jgi:hypothetical protein
VSYRSHAFAFKHSADKHFIDGELSGDSSLVAAASSNKLS